MYYKEAAPYSNYDGGYSKTASYSFDEQLGSPLIIGGIVLGIIIVVILILMMSKSKTAKSSQFAYY